MQLSNNIATVSLENNYTFTDLTPRLLSPVEIMQWMAHLRLMYLLPTTQIVDMG